MLRGGALGAYHNIHHQLGSMSEPPLSPTASSSQVRTMPFLMTTRCSESSAQPTSGTSSPFNFISGDGFLGPVLDSKHDNCPVPITTSANTLFPSSRREEILSEDPAVSAAQAAPQQLFRGSSFQSGGGETNNAQSSGTSAGSSQLSNDGRNETAVQRKDEFSHGQRHATISTANDHDQNTTNGAELSNDSVVDWGGNQQAPVIITEHSTVHQNPSNIGQEGRTEKTLTTLEAQEPGSTQDHKVGSTQTVFISDRNPKEEVQNSTFKQQSSENLHSSSESVRAAYPGESVTHSNASEIFPAYSTCLMSSDSYNFPTGAKLLGVPTQMPSRHGAVNVPNSVQSDESGPFGNIGALYPNQNLVGRLGYSTPLKGSWTSMATQYSNNSLLDNNVHSSLQVMSPLVGTPVSSLLSESLQDNSYSHGEPHYRDGTSYFSSPQTQTDAAMQLCLNHNFGGPSTDSDASASPGNLVHMSNTGVDQLSMHGNHNQHHFLTNPLPPTALAQSTLTERSHLLAHQVIDPAVSGCNQGYSNWRNGGNELLFLSGRDSTVHTQPFSGQLSAQLQQAELAISQTYGSRQSPNLPSVNQVPHSFFQNGDHGQSPPGIGNCQFQGLSLSLSSQQPSSLQLHPNLGRTDHEADIDAFTVISQASAEAKGKRVDCSDGRYNGILSRFRPQRDDHDLAISAAAQRLHNYGHPAEAKHHLLVNSSSDPFLASTSNVSYGCKYLKLSQIVLNELCMITRRERRTASHDHRRAHVQRSTWCTDQPSSTSASNCNSLVNFHATRDVMGADSTRKDFMMINNSSLITESREREAVYETHVQSEGREEVEKKKLRMGTFLDEVDRRYRAYSEHMMNVINQFNSIAGPDAATPYTALALQAMSRHFRCLRDAVSMQLRTVKRLLGEQDTSPKYAGRDLSSLRSVDQQLRQQRALQQLGMLQQHAWRPQRGLPERAVSVLRSWLFEHFLHPYPKDSDKLFLAKQTGLTRSQVSNWFINARVRLWKPMVEEMYLEEFSNSDEGGSGERNNARERIREHEAMDYDEANIGSRFSNGHAEPVADKQHQITIASGGDGIFPHSNFRSAHDSTQNELSTNNLTFNADQRSTGILKKARNSTHNSNHVPSPIASMDIGSDSPSPFQDPCRLDASYGSPADQDYNQQQQDILASSSGGRFSAYLGAGLTGYPGTTSFVSRATASTNGGVSLTLGLRHSDGLTLSGAAASQQKYSSQGHHSSQRTKDHVTHYDTGVHDDEVRNMNNAHSELPLSHLNPGQDGLKQRNRIPSHLLHEFVAQG